MGDKIIITEDEDKPAKPDVVVVQPQAATKEKKVVTERTTVTEVTEE